MTSSPVTRAQDGAARTAVEVRMEGLSRHYGPVVALDRLDLTLHPGELIALLGPSGCGKTTTLRLLAGLEDADSGHITVGGKDITRVSAAKRDMGMVFQAYSLFPHMTVRQNVAFGLRLRRVDAAKRDRRALEMLDLVGLSTQADRYPHQISGGQQQRVALARALAIEPTVVLMDEPFASLDAHLRASVRADVQRIFHEAGTTAILVTHDQDEALSVADCVAVLRDGKIAQCAAPEDLYTAPADPALAAFVGEANLLPGVHVAGSVQTVLGLLPLHQNGGGFPPSGNVTVLVRPEQIELGPPDGSIRATVVAYGYHGHDAVLHVQVQQGHDARPLIVRTSGGTNFSPGTHVALSAHGPVLVWPAC